MCKVLLIFATSSLLVNAVLKDFHYTFFLDLKKNLKHIFIFQKQKCGIPLNLLLYFKNIFQKIGETIFLCIPCVIFYISKSSFIFMPTKNVGAKKFSL